MHKYKRQTNRSRPRGGAEVQGATPYRCAPKPSRRALRPHGNQGRGGMGTRIKVREIAQRLEVGPLAVYAMLEQGIIPGVRVGRRWIVTRWAYEQWERNCGVHSPSPES